MEENSKSREKENIINDISQNRNDQSENVLSLSKKIYGEMLYKTQYDKNSKEERSLSNDINPNQFMHFIKAKYRRNDF